MLTKGSNCTWGLFERQVGNHNIRALVAPDYVEKHNPTLDGQGLLYWIETNSCLGSAFIVRQGGKGNQHTFQEEPDSVSGRSRTS